MGLSLEQELKLIAGYMKNTKRISEQQSEFINQWTDFSIRSRRKSPNDNGAIGVFCNAILEGDAELHAKGFDRLQNKGESSVEIKIRTGEILFYTDAFPLSYHPERGVEQENEVEIEAENIVTGEKINLDEEEREELEEIFFESALDASDTEAPEPILSIERWKDLIKAVRGKDMHPIMIAAEDNNHIMMQHILEEESQSIHELDQHGNSPLHIAAENARHPHSMRKIIDLAQQHGFDITKKNSKGEGLTEKLPNLERFQKLKIELEAKILSSQRKQKESAEPSIGI